MGQSESRHDLTSVTLSGIRSGGITGTPSVLPNNWQLTQGYLVGPEANLTGADLSCANLSGATLSTNTRTYDRQTVLQHGANFASNLTIVSEPTTLLLALLALLAMVAAALGCRELVQKSAVCRDR